MCAFAAHRKQAVFYLATFILHTSSDRLQDSRRVAALAFLEKSGEVFRY